MSNPNPVRTPEFLEKAKATQFGGENANNRNCEKETPTRAWSNKLYRDALRYISLLEIPEEYQDDIIGWLKLQRRRREGKDPNFAMVATVRVLEKLYAKPNGELFDKIINQTEGEQVKKTQELPPPEVIPTKFANAQEAAAWYAQECKREE